MTTIQLQDRPIHPNKQYLQQKQFQHKKNRQIHQYLRKHQLNDQVLPCFRDNYVHVKKQKKNHLENKKSKAEIYEEIKKKNIEKFGYKKHEEVKKQQNETKQKKIDPLKMTIQYKPKTVVIDTTQYKLKSEQKDQQVSKSHVTQRPNHFEQTAKQKYEKLLQIVRKQKMELNQQKENFQKHKEKLSFKKMIEKQHSVPFLNEIKKSIQDKKKLQKSHRVECKARKQKEESLEKQNQQKYVKSQQKQVQNQPTKKQSLSEVHSRILKLQQQKEDIEQQIYRNKYQVIDPNDVVQKKYSLEKVTQIPAFDVECFRDFIDLRSLHPQGNEFYKIAIKVFETGLNVKEVKMKLQVDNLDAIKQSSQKVITSVDYKRKFQGQTRITKYNNGWTEVWNPGVQRLMANEQLFYKVIWLRNGDIKQEWKDKKLQSYYSKEKEVVQIKFGKFQPIYFFVQLSQLEQYNPIKRIKTVMFREGRVQTFSTDNDHMNGFAA